MSGVLKDKVAIITGASRGMGKAFALKFAEEGAKLLLTTTSLERAQGTVCLLYTSPSPRDRTRSRMPSSA